jgi:lantibiotic leader peptide-processing serine protease
MKRKWTVAALTTALATTALAGSAFAAPQSTAETMSYLVAFQKDLPADYSTIISNAGGQVVRAIPELGGVEVSTSNPHFLGNLKGVSGILSAGVEMTHKLDYKLNDPAAADGLPVTDIPQPENTSSYWNYQWDIQKVTHGGDSYKLETGGTKNADGTVTHKAVVGVIDSGIDANHPDLKGNFLGGRNFVPAGVDASETGNPTDVRDRDGHGTHVAGSIAANGKLKGVGPDLGIRSYRVFPEGAGAPTSWIAAAIVAAANDGVDVINMSIGGFDGVARYNYQGNYYHDVADIAVYKRAIRYAINKGVTVVVAAGNETLNLNNPTEIADYMNQEYGSLGYTFKGAAKEVPGGLPGVITVSSSNKWSNTEIAFYSNYGQSAIEVAAPGGDNGPVYAQTGDLNQRDFHYRALSTWPTYLAPYFTANLHSYALLHGTSMASPKVAGIAGVIKAAHPELSPSQVSNLIQQTALDLGKPGVDAFYGRGEANVYNALTSK